MGNIVPHHGAFARYLAYTCHDHFLRRLTFVKPLLQSEFSGLPDLNPSRCG
jgi:hypothetical protein